MTPNVSRLSDQGALAPAEPSRLRRLGVAAALLAGLVLVLWSTIRLEPLRNWLFFHYAAYWTASLTWFSACFAIGHVTVKRIAGRSFPLFEQLSVSFAVGVFEFELLMFLAGLLRLYGTLFFFGLPLVLLAASAPFLLRDAHVRNRKRLWRVLTRKGPSALGWAMIAFGIVALVALYLPTMIAENVAFDSRWRHMALAEQYVVYGGIRRFPEGWVFAASPHFTPLLFTWGFMLPGSRLFDRMVLCAHLEDVCFIFVTLVGIPAVVRRLIPRANPALVWVARFAFPGVFLYDSSLCGGTDHIGAVFAAALFLLALDYWRRPTPRIALLLGSLIAAVLCAKETTGLLLAPAPILVVCVRTLVDAFAALRARRWSAGSWLPALIAGAVTLILTAPHWLKNIVWYGDPVYPNLASMWPLRPWLPDGEYIFRWVFLDQNLWRPPPGVVGLIQTLKALVTFSFIPNDWPSMHRDLPVFGSLFTVLMLALPFVRRARRIWLLALWVHFSILIWYFVHHEDRYLQVVVPWMAAMVAAIATALWRSQRWPGRFLLAALVTAQVVCGLDVYFFPTHSMIGASGVKAAVEFLGQGYRGNTEARFGVQTQEQAIGAKTPVGSTILLHERREFLGFERATVADFYSDQYAIDYRTLISPDRVYMKLRELGVTHLMWLDQFSTGYAPLAADVVFFDFVYRHTRSREHVGTFQIAEMPKKRPKRRAPSWVAVVGCGHEYADGLYQLADLGVPRYGPAHRSFPAPPRPLVPGPHALDEVDSVVVDGDCAHPAELPLRGAFEEVAHRPLEGGTAAIWVRTRRRS